MVVVWWTLGVLVAFVAGAAWGFRRAWTADSRRRTAAMRGVLVVATLLVSAAATEAWFALVFEQSCGWNFTLASKRWFAKHWRPINSDGFRDREWRAADVAGRDVVFCVGDSFTAGQGVADPGDRFSAELQRRLGPGAAVLNVAKNGWSTPDQIAALRHHPIRPDRVVLAYYLNDILAAARGAGVPFETRPLPRPEGPLGAVVEESHFANWAYWSVYRFGRSYYGESAQARMVRLYASDAAWKAHRRELAELVAVVRGRGAELAVVVFPHMTDVAGSAPLTRRVAAEFAALGVPVLDLAPRLEDRAARTLIASPLDAHPSAAVHREVGAWIHERFFAGVAAPR